MKKYFMLEISVSLFEDKDIIMTSNATNADLKGFLQTDLFDEYAFDD